jgi:Fic family protein
MIKLVSELIQQRDAQTPGSLYYWTQILFSYNSNHLEGTQLTQDQTQELFETGRLTTTTSIKFDDALETANHFRAFDQILNTIDDPLSKQYIFDLHQILKGGTSQDWDPRYNVGGFKHEAKMLAGQQLSTSAAEAPDQTIHLFCEWNRHQYTDLADFAAFHKRFEVIHPFSDGSGRIGRLLLFKELCRCGQMPFFISSDRHTDYLDALAAYTADPGQLCHLFATEQQAYTQAVLQLNALETTSK